jgi:multiple sugar transport system substrate-binding protein
MSGAGADIYAMDIIPYHKFVDSGTLEDLQPYMNADPVFNRGDYRQNVLDAVRYKGGTWLIPMVYRFSYFSYDTTLVNAGAAGFGADKTWSAGGLFNIGIPLYDGTHELFNLINYDSEGEGMFVLLLNENMQSFVNAETKKAAFTDGRFLSLLESVKRYGEEGLLLQPIVGRSDATIIRNLEENRYFFKLQDEFSLEEQFRRNSGMQSMGWGLSSGMVRSINDDDEIAGIQALADGSVSFRTYNSFAMNSQSKNKALAWAFIKFLLSDEMQLSANLFGYPLNNNARSEKLEFSFSGYGNISINNDRQRQGLADYKAAVERMSDNINTFLVQDPNIKDMIASEVKYYFEGSRTANEVARVLQNKVDFYLNE